MLREWVRTYMKDNIKFSNVKVPSYLYTNSKTNRSNRNTIDNISYSVPRWFKEDEEPDWYKDVIKRWNGTASIMPD